MAEEVTGEGEFARFKQISPWREWEGCKKRYVYVVGSCAFKAQVVMKDDNEVAALIEWLGAKEECKEAKAEGDEVTVQFETQATMLKVEAALADNDLVESVTIAEEGRCEGMVIDRHLQCIVPAASVVHDETEHKNLLPLPKAVIMAQGYSAALTLGIPISNGFFVKIAASSCPTKRIVICPNPSISRLYTGEKFASEITNRVADLYQTRVTCIVPLFDKPPFKNPLSIFTVPASALSSEVVSAVTTVHPYVSMQAGAIISHDVWYDCRSRKIVADTERRVASNVAWASVNQIAADVTMLREAVLDSGLFGESEVPLLPVGVEAIAAEGKAKWTKEDCRTHLIARDSIQSILKTWSSANEAAASPSPAPTPTPTPAAAAAAPTSRVSTASTTNAPAAAPIPRKVAPPTAVKVPKRSLPPGSTLQHLLNTSHHNDAQSLRSAKVHLAALFRCQKYRSKEQGFLAIREYYDGNTCTFVVTVGNRQFAYVRGYPNKRHNLFLDSLKIAMRTAGATKLAADASSAEGQAPYLFNRVYALQYEKAPADTSREMNMDRDRERERDRERIEKIERERLEKDRMAERERDRERLERLEAERKHRLLERRRVEEMQAQQARVKEDKRRAEEERRRQDERRRAEERRIMEEERKRKEESEKKKKEEAMQRRRDELEMQRRRDLDRKRAETERKRRREEPPVEMSKKRRLDPSMVSWFKNKMEQDLIGIRKPIINNLTDDAHRRIDKADEIVEGWEQRARSVKTAQQSLACWYLLDSIIKRNSDDSRYRKIVEPRLGSLGPYLPSRIDAKHRDACTQLLNTWVGLFPERVLNNMKSQV